MRRDPRALGAWPLVLAAWAAALVPLAEGGAPDGDDERKKKEVLKLALEGPRIRSHAPVRVRVTFDWTGTRLLEGNLALDLRSGPRLVTSYRSHEIALATGERTVDLLLPSLTSELPEPTITAAATFVTPRRQYRFEPTLWAVPHVLERSCVVGVSQMDLGWDEELRVTRQGLRLEAFQVVDEKAMRLPRNLDTKFVYLPPADFPAHPLSYCSYDVLLLGGRGFAGLRERQLGAIARWVRAGGSVCVAPSGALADRHQRFLNDLAGVGPAFQLGVDGMLLPPDPSLVGTQDAQSCRLHCGLGRLVVLLDPPRTVEDLKGASWRLTACFLWKMRLGQTVPILGTGHWNQERQVQDDEAAYDPRLAGLRTWVLPIAAPSALLSGLVPETVQVLPFGFVVLILVLFVIAIGPADYWLLGVLRLRRFTWLLFPIVAGAFALFTIRLTEHYMGSVDEVRSLLFIDVDRQGQPLRQSRFDLHFTAGERTVHCEMRNALIYAMARGGRTARGELRTRVSIEEGDLYDETAAEPLTYEGLLPSQYTATLRYRQYTPHLNRLFSLEPAESLPDLDWAAVTPKALADPRSPGNVAAELYRGRRGTGSVYVFHRGAVRQLYGTRQPFAQFLTNGDGRRSLLQRVCVRPAEGLFHYVSQIAPTGAPSFEDLAILDPDDPAQWLLVVVEERGDELLVYRCLYRGSE